MQLRLVDVLMEVTGYDEVKSQQRDPLQDNADEPVHRDAHQPLTELAIAVGDRGDDDGGQRDVHRARQHDGVRAAIDEHHLPQLPGVSTSTMMNPRTSTA